MKNLLEKFHGKQMVSYALPLHTHSLPLHVLKKRTRWFRVSEGGTRENSPSVESSIRASVSGLDEADMVGEVTKCTQEMTEVVVVVNGDGRRLGCGPAHA